MKNNKKVEWIKINNLSYLCIIIVVGVDINNVAKKDVQRFARKNFNIACNQTAYVIHSDYLYKIFEISSSVSTPISNECINGIEDYILDLA